MRQRIVGVTAFQSRRDARRPHQRVVNGVVGKARGRSLIAFRDCRHVGSDRSLFDLRHPLEVRAGDFVELHRELELRDLSESFRELIDRIVRSWYRAVPTSVVRRKSERDINLLARPDAVVEPLPILESPAAALVERERSIDQVAMLRKKP